MSHNKIVQPHGRQSRKIKYHDAIYSIGSDVLLLLRQHGRELIVVEGHKMRAFVLSDDDAQVAAQIDWELKLNEVGQAIVDTAVGVLVASTVKDQTVLYIVDRGKISKVVSVRGSLSALTASATEAVIGTKEVDSSAGRLWRIDIARKTIIAEKPLTNAQVDLQLDLSGRWLAVVDRLTNTVTTVSATLGEMASMTVAYSQARVPSISSTCECHDMTHQDPNAGCCCCKCISSGQPGTQPGGAGVPTGNGGTVGAHGGRVCLKDRSPDVRPCCVDLLWSVDRLVQTSDFIIAMDDRQRHIALLAFSPFRIVQEWQFGRQGYRIALDREAPVMLVHNVGTREWQLMHLDAIDNLSHSLDKSLPPVLIPDSAEFHGHLNSLMEGHANPKGPIKALVFPVIEGAQSFLDSDTSKFDAYLNRTMTPNVVDYYIENSFNQLRDISFHYFARDVGPIGSPLKLPRNHLSEYFYPDWNPAKLIITKTGVSLGAHIIFDGREKMRINVQPDGNPLPPIDTMEIQFAALAFDKLPAASLNHFPLQVRFSGTERLALSLQTASGNITLNLRFTAQTIDINDTSLDHDLDLLATYLDDIMRAAETTAGLTTRLFAKPNANRIRMRGLEFGRLVVTFASTSTTGPKLAVRSATATGIGITDPLGVTNPLVGDVQVNSLVPLELKNYLNLMLDIAEADKGFDENSFRLDDVSVDFNSGTSTLTTTIPISTIVGGPSGSLSLVESSELQQLFDSSSTVPNSDTTFNNRKAIRDFDQLCNDVFTAAVQRFNDPNEAKAKLGHDAGWDLAMIFPVEPAINTPGDPESVQPWETWNVNSLFRPFEFRGVELVRTAFYANDKSVQLQGVWTLDFFTSVGKPDIAMICHEIGHGIGFRDLYWNTGYRDDLAYLDDWAMMCNHWNMPHHSGYHKLQAQWITDTEDRNRDQLNRVLVIPPTAPNQTIDTEVLMVPVELWDNAYVNDARAAFGASTDMKVVQLVRLDLGGDGAVYDLIEARQVVIGKHFSQHLPKTSGILITNAIEPWDDQRYAFNGAYRRELHLLNPNNILSNPGDSFDLARAPELPAKGITVSVIDRKMVRDANVFRIKVTRTNTDFIDLYFSSADPYYKNPDLWVDWAGDNVDSRGNPSRDPKDHHDYPIGQTTDQGEAVRVPHTGTELHWVVARLRNRGGVEALDVKLNFKICIPPGGGDRSGNFQSIGMETIHIMPGGDVALPAVRKWEVPQGFTGHTCIAVEIADYRIPSPGGSALATDDVWIANNHAQKNVDEFIPLQSSPYDLTEFDYSVHNDAPRQEYAYLEPDGLPYGMKLTVTPNGQLVPAKSTVMFRCKLELDDKILDAGCRSDRQFRLITWRRETESSTKWGGVQYKVRPRKRCAVTLKGYWRPSNDEIRLDGTVSPDPGGGIVRIRLAFEGQDAFWTPVVLGTGGVFTWQGRSSATSLDAIAAFEGTALYGPAQSPPLKLYRTIIR
jgi:hypothetical protein